MNFYQRPPFVVYSLSDPETGEIRYIGKTFNFKSRYRAHTAPSARKGRLYVHRWIATLYERGLRPSMKVIQDCFSEANSFEAEMHWIAHFRSKGCRLCNISNGGGAHSGFKKSEYEKKEISRRLTGRKYSDESRVRLRESHMSFTPEQREEIKILKKTNSYSVLGRKYGVSPGTIFNAVHDNYYPTQKYINKK